MEYNISRKVIRNDRRRRAQGAERKGMKKPIYKRWWFWMMMMLVLLANLVSAGYGMDALGAVCLPL